MEGLVPVLLNAVVIVLLCAAILFGVRLHRRLTALQSAQSELAALLGRLDGALVHASSTVSALKYNAARQFDAAPPAAPKAPVVPVTAPRMPTPAPMAMAPRPVAPVQTIKTAPTHVEVAKAAPGRRRKPTASLVSGSHGIAADELIAVMKSMRHAG